MRANTIVGRTEASCSSRAAKSIANVGPQHTFVVPNGILDPNGSNTVALAVTSDGGSGYGLERVALTNLAAVRGGVPVTMNAAPTS